MDAKKETKQSTGVQDVSKSKPPEHTIPKDIYVELSKRHPSRWLLALLSDWLVIILVFIIAHMINHLVAYALAVFIIGTRQHAIAILGHEGAHYTISKMKPLNEVLAQVLCFWPFALDMFAYQQFHVAHHRYLNTTADPEMTYRQMGAPEWDVPCSRTRIVTRFVIDLLGYGVFEVYRMLHFTMPKTLRAALGPVAVFILAAAVWTGNIWIVVMWYAAIFTGFAGVWRLRCWMEHLAVEGTHRLHLSWWQAWLFAPHNIWLHWEHHHWAGIPYWSLPRLRAMTPSVPVMRLSALFKYYEQCEPITSGTPTRK